MIPQRYNQPSQNVGHSTEQMAQVLQQIYGFLKREGEPVIERLNHMQCSNYLDLV